MCRQEHSQGVACGNPPFRITPSRKPVRNLSICARNGVSIRRNVRRDCTFATLAVLYETTKQRSLVPLEPPRALRVEAQVLRVSWAGRHVPVADAVLREMEVASEILVSLLTCLYFCGAELALSSNTYYFNFALLSLQEALCRWKIQIATTGLARWKLEGVGKTFMIEIQAYTIRF